MFDIVKNIKNGESFGELALIYNDKRSATIICKTESVILSITK